MPRYERMDRESESVCKEPDLMASGSVYFDYLFTDEESGRESGAALTYASPKLLVPKSKDFDDFRCLINFPNVKNIF